MHIRIGSLTALFAVLLAAATFSTAQGTAQNPAPTPPMGWNSWDAYGFTIDEAQFKANAAVLAGLRKYGWQYAVIDEGWYMQNPFGADVAARKYLLDANGILIPDVSRFPSSADAAGFKPLADWLHARGLKFGVHIVRGIPRQAVAENLPIAGTSFHAADAADTSSPCPWDEGNWGVKDNAAGQAYYDSMLKLYAGWGLDFIKVDCISDHPYRLTEIRQIAEAIRKTGRPIVLSLSPGPTQLSHAAEVGKYAQMWRITNDHWDAWSFGSNHTADGFPFGLQGDFDMLADWAPYAKPGNWPDADMLPDGWLGPHPGWGEARESRLTHDEQRTEFTLWAIAWSPLIFGGNLTKLDAFSRSLMSNKDLIEADQKAVESHPVTKLPAGFEDVRVWESSEDEHGHSPDFVALFNLNDKPVTLHFTWEQLGVKSGREVRDIWNGSKRKTDAPMEIALPAHGSTIYRVR